MTANGPQHHPCGCVNNSLICPCTATLPVATPAQHTTARLVYAADRARVGADAAGPPPRPRGDNR